LQRYKIPKLNVALGYGAEGMITGNKRDVQIQHIIPKIQAIVSEFGC
jgi:hypothetical protein